MRRKTKIRLSLLGQMGMILLAFALVLGVVLGGMALLSRAVTPPFADQTYRKIHVFKDDTFDPVAAGKVTLALAANERILFTAPDTTIVKEENNVWKAVAVGEVTMTAKLQAKAEGAADYTDVTPVVTKTFKVFVENVKSAVTLEYANGVKAIGVDVPKLQEAGVFLGCEAAGKVVTAAGSYNVNVLYENKDLYYLSDKGALLIASNVKDYYLLRNTLVNGTYTAAGTWDRYIVLDKDNILWQYTYDAAATTASKIVGTKLLPQAVKQFKNGFVLDADGNLYDLNTKLAISADTKIAGVAWAAITGWEFDNDYILTSAATTKTLYQYTRSEAAGVASTTVATINTDVKAMLTYPAYTKADATYLGPVKIANIEAKDFAVVVVDEGEPTEVTYYYTLAADGKLYKATPDGAAFTYAQIDTDVTKLTSYGYIQKVGAAAETKHEWDGTAYAGPDDVVTPPVVNYEIATGKLSKKGTGGAADKPLLEGVASFLDADKLYITRTDGSIWIMAAPFATDTAIYYVPAAIKTVDLQYELTNNGVSIYFDGATFECALDKLKLEVTKLEKTSTDATAKKVFAAVFYNFNNDLAKETFYNISLKDVTTTTTGTDVTAKKDFTVKFPVPTSYTAATSRLIKVNPGEENLMTRALKVETTLDGTAFLVAKMKAFSPSYYAVAQRNTTFKAGDFDADTVDVGEKKGDERIDLADVVFLMRYAAEWDSHTYAKFTGYKGLVASKDAGKYTLEDIVYLLRHVAEWEDNIYIPKP